MLAGSIASTDGIRYKLIGGNSKADRAMQFLDFMMWLAKSECIWDIIDIKKKDIRSASTWEIKGKCLIVKYTKVCDK